jgi:peptidoglycan/xylan/chitin deacetylase (PgdA/CDA1 family)
VIGRPPIVALTYHDVAAASDRGTVGFPGPTAARYKLDPAALRAHLDAIAATAARVGVVDPDAPLPQVALTFDDGGSSAPAAAEALEARGWRGHFFVTTERIGTPGFLAPDDILNLAARGHVVGSHSHSHPTYMGRLSRAAIAEEWERSRAILAELLGAPPAIASVPGGSLSRVVVDAAAAAGYRVLMTSEPVARPASRGGILVIGRYTIWASTPTRRVRAYVSGAVGPRARTWLGWNAKKVAKRTNATAYESLRRLAARS